MNNEPSRTIIEILQKILLLQRQDFINDISSCDRPFLGPLNSSNYNTRPIELYNAYTATPWSFSYTSGTTTETTSIFRIEYIEQCCAVVRLLGIDTETQDYINTNQFATIDLSTVGAIQCLTDTYITL